ncbi:MAG: hydrogenase maturation protease [Armatimonadota bacterium]|nr:hydrogenase maturation protease [Armatimonadota bacterium]
MGRRILVVGCGNASRRDDGVGLYVLRALMQRLPVQGEVDEDTAQAEGELPTREGPASLQLRFEHQLDIVLAAELANVDLFVVIDAHTGAFPEQIRRVSVKPGYEPSMTSHHLTAETVVGLGQALHGHVPRAMLYSVRGHDFNFGNELTPGTRAAADQVVEEILDLLGTFAGEAPSP